MASSSTPRLRAVWHMPCEECPCAADVNILAIKGADSVDNQSVLGIADDAVQRQTGTRKEAGA